MEKGNHAKGKFSMFHEQFDRNYYTVGYTFDRVENDMMVFTRISDPLTIFRVKPQDFLRGLENKSIWAYHWYCLTLNDQMSREEVIAFVQSLIPEQAPAL